MKRMVVFAVFFLSVFFFYGCVRGGEAVTFSFDDDSSLDGWKFEGAVGVDALRARGESGASLEVGPGGRAVLELRDSDAGGVVEFWVFENCAVPSEAKKRQTGPYYGIVAGDGRVLAPGSFYAPYLNGSKTYAVTGFNPEADEKSFFNVQYLGLKRTEGWHKWTFLFDCEQGVSLLHNDEDVNSRRERFKWYRTKVAGFTGFVVAGDTTADGGQTVWIDDVTVTLGGSMNVTPEELAPPPPPPATPEKDPVPSEPARIVEELRGVHPRLLFTADDIPAIRKKIRTGYGKNLYDRMVEYLPSCRKPDHTRFLKDATDGQRQGFWRLPTVALHSVVSGDSESFDRTVEFMKFLMELEHWETHELDCGMSSANIMVGAALAYDWLYNDLDPEFRADFRDKLLLMARRQYHQGHLMKQKGTHYWQGDPANNHRFHRNAGMVLAVLAVAGEDRTDDDWLLSQALRELRFVARWLPDDGTCHESPTYAAFGNTHLVLAFDAAQRCFGEPFLDLSYFRNAPFYKVQAMRPDLEGVFPYGDTGGGSGGYNSYLHRLCAYHNLADCQAAISEMERRNEDFFNFTWFSVIWWQDLGEGDINALPRHAFFPDLGLSYFRTGWQASDAGAMFKCGPFGGYKLNGYRHSNDMKYINVAHDDPDANSFVLFADGEILAETDRYSKHKQSANHNTILINGTGQVAGGRPEGRGWSQPGGDMSVMGVITSYAGAEGVAAIEGEAAGSYLANRRKGSRRPRLDRFRRIFVWIEDRYILVLDDIRAPEPVDVTWLMQGPSVEVVDRALHRYALQSGTAVCPFQVFASQDVSGQVAVSSADHRGRPKGWEQLQLSTRTSAVRFVSVYDPWHTGDLSVAFEADGPDRGTVTVTGSDGTSDSWDWTAGHGRFGPSRLVGRDPGGGMIIAMTEPEEGTGGLLEEIGRLTSKQP